MLPSWYRLVRSRDVEEVSLCLKALNMNQWLILALRM